MVYNVSIYAMLRPYRGNMGGVKRNRIASVIQYNNIFLIPSYSEGCVIKAIL